MDRLIDLLKAICEVVKYVSAILTAAITVHKLLHRKKKKAKQKTASRKSRS